MKWVRIRGASPHDIDGIMKVEEAGFTLPWPRDDLERDIGENILSAYFVAETSGAVCGYAGMWVVADECHIMTIAVAPEHRRAGIGAMLLMKLIDEARLRGASKFFLEVRASNAPDISMYEKFGFRAIDVRKAYYEEKDTREDAIVMMRGNYSNVTPFSPIPEPD
jgi:ribosomal-protein-alanine N-acetyltransferase